MGVLSIGLAGWSCMGCGSVEPRPNADADAAPSVVDATVVDVRVPFDAPLVDAPPRDGPLRAMRVFVSSQVYTGNLGGLAGADTKCQTVANAAGLTGTYKAWLSNATIAATTRLTHATIPYALVDGTIVANDWTSLTSGSLLHAIDLTELGTHSLGGTSVDCYFGGTGMFAWTNTDVTGLVANASQTSSCGGDWSSAGPTNGGGPFGVVGIIGSSDAMWTVSCGSARCENTAPLYCLEQ